MTGHNVTHGMFSLKRTYDAAPERVFRAFSTLEGKSQWFTGVWTATERSFDFREGGTEIAEGRWPNGMVSRFEAHYSDIIENARIIYAYVMHIDGRKISVSLATVEFAATGTGTRLTITEQGAFLDGFEDGGGREHGTGQLLDQLGAALAAGKI
ncbi:SRPBCC family protein [soil metagenome]